MMRKIFGAKSITHLIYGLLMLMPFVAIGVKCAYAVVNKNAYQSYDSGNVKTLVNLTSGTVYDGSTYEVNYTTQPQDYGYSQLWIYSEISINPEDYGFLETYDGVQLFNNGTIGFRNSDTQVTEYAGNVWGVSLTTFTFKCKEEKNIFIGGNSTLDKVIYVKNSIDNVFYYAIDEVIEENNIGLLDFTSWFDGWILKDNAMNNRFVGFANWYMNFAFLVSACYVLFLCMLWFVNFARRLLDRGMNYDW